MCRHQLPPKLEALLAAMPLSSVRVRLEFAREVRFDATALTLALAPSLKRSLWRTASARVQSPTVSAADTAAVAQIIDGSRQKYSTPVDQANRQLAKLYDLNIETLGSKPEQAPGGKTNPVFQVRGATSEQPVAASSQALLDLYRHVNE